MRSFLESRVLYDGRVPDLARHAFALLLHFGLLGLIVLSVLDSSFLFLPIGNDLLLIALVSQNPDNLFLYVIGAALGSAAGVWTVDALSRKMGEDGLTKLASKKRLDYLKKKMKQNAAVVIVLACLAPPPFPFTAIIAAASALQYPRLRLFLLVAGALCTISAGRPRGDIFPRGNLADRGLQRIHVGDDRVRGTVRRRERAVHHPLDSAQPVALRWARINPIQ